jgi:hypothetical protein
VGDAIIQISSNRFLGIFRKGVLPAGNAFFEKFRSLERGMFVMEMEKN